MLKKTQVITECCAFSHMTKKRITSSNAMSRRNYEQWARGSYTGPLHYMYVQNSACASMENCLALRFSKRYNEPAKKHLVCTNSLLSSVQAFIMSVTLLLQNPLV